MRRHRGRLDAVGPSGVELVKATGDHNVYAVIDGRRLRFGWPQQFERAGLRWEDVRELSPDQLEAIPDGGQLEIWE
jgi:hypothetical protein